MERLLILLVKLEYLIMPSPSIPASFPGMKPNARYFVCKYFPNETGAVSSRILATRPLTINSSKE